MPRYQIQTTRDLMKELAPLHVRGRTLDLGAGTAKYREIFKPHLSEYITCDCFDGPLIDHVEDAHNLSFPDESFDTVICTMVMEHVREPWTVAKEIKRILKPGGRCIVTAPFMFPFHQDPEDYFRYTIPGMESLFSGLRTVDARPLRGMWSLAESIIRMCLFSPYLKERQGFFRRNIHRAAEWILMPLDRILPSPKDIFCEVLYIGEK